MNQRRSLRAARGRASLSRPLQDAQLPKGERQRAILATLVQFFKSHPDKEYAFERCAGDLIRMMDANVVNIDLTRPWKDGGRDGF